MPLKEIKIIKPRSSYRQCKFGGLLASHTFSLDGPRRQPAIVLSAVAQSAAFSSRRLAENAPREVPPSATTKDARPCVARCQRGSWPQPQPDNALLGIRLAHTSARCYQRHVSAVARWDVCVYAEIRFPRPQDLSRVTLGCRVGCVNSRAVVRCGRCRPKQLINIDLRRVHGLCGYW